MTALFYMTVMLPAFALVSRGSLGSETQSTAEDHRAEDNAVREDAEQDKEKPLDERPLEDIFNEYEDIDIEYREPIVMTEMMSGNKKKFIYHYPKTTVVSFRAFDNSFDLMLKRRDSVFSSKVSLTDYSKDDPDKNFKEDKCTGPCGHDLNNST